MPRRWPNVTDINDVAWPAAGTVAARFDRLRYHVLAIIPGSGNLLHTRRFRRGGSYTRMEQGHDSGVQLLHFRLKAQFISRLATTAWDFGTQERTHFIVGGMIRHLLRADRPTEDIFGGPLPGMQTVGDVAVIPISGVMMLNVPDLIKSVGFNVTDINDVEGEISQALKDANISMIALHYHSPGGESVAGQKLFDLVEAAALKKPVLSFSGDGEMMCSASYNGGAPSTAIFLGRYCEAVNIGTYALNLDDTGFWEQLGMKWEVFRSGEYKAMGIDALSDKQRKYLQGTVDEFGRIFRAGVLKHRSAVTPENMEGQTYRGIEAVKFNFADGIAKDLAEAIARFRRVL
jgi:ClpP class serine protease